MSSEHPSLRLSSPLSSSPGRSAPLFSRPAWPWSPYNSSRPSSVHSSSSFAGPTRPQWDISRVANAMGTPTQANLSAANMTRQESHRQWSFTSFEWVVRDVDRLRGFIEESQPEVASSSSSSDERLEDDFEILKESPILGDNKFKLEIARTGGAEEMASSQTKPATLSLYLTSLMLDYAHEYEAPASIMAAIKASDDRIGTRPAWVWQFWHNDWVFRRDSEVWECPLPPLSALQENLHIRRADSFVICLQVHSPMGPQFPQHPSAYYVPRDLLDGLEASLDNANTGDVRFVCLERRPIELQSSPAASESGHSQATASRHTFSADTTARKRVIYAHSDILIRRSDYFATMLNSSFSEAQGGIPGERKLYTIVVDEADFETMYWLLKYCYANWVHFKDCDDPRTAVEGVGAGWNARWLSMRGDEWAWKTFHKSNDSDDNVTADTRSVASGGSLPSTEDVTSLTRTPIMQPPQSISASSSSTARPASSRISGPSKAGSNSASTSSRQQGANTTRRTAVSPSATSVNVSLSSSISKPVNIPLSPNQPFSASAHYPISPRSSRNHLHPDPHPHPTPEPSPASALAMYQLAHRYQMPALASLALEHMMTTITPNSSFALLLATTIWEDLHILIEDYVVEKWDEVSVCEEFELCCQEISAGEWGTEGGKTLTALFRRLRSPVR
ncbi:hypothetical protein HGRIS_009368 [Hohenbuehelia grisea]|uniref:BTB domain-containing protein n=1 Tax=Hohenbuehelia grisea TaxID=104357 RepID=A0ABR3J1F8_9AGAR